MLTPKLTPHTTSTQTISEVTRTLSTFRDAMPQTRTAIRSTQQVLNRSIHEIMNADSHSIVSKLKFKKILNHCMKDIMQPENFINNGRESKVYRIDDEFVAKIKRGKSAESAIPFYSYPSCPSTKFKEIDCYYGEPIIRVGNVEILKNATPKEDAISCGATFKRYLSDSNIQDYYEQYLPKCSELPQGSFDELAESLSKLNKLSQKSKFNRVYFMPDTINPNNIIISGDKFRLVDKFDQTPTKNPNSVYTLLEPLLIRYNAEILAKPREEYTDMRKNIFEKIMIAANKSNLPMRSSFKDTFRDHTLQQLVNMPCGSLIGKIHYMMGSGASVAEREAYIKEFIANPNMHIDF